MFFQITSVVILLIALGYTVKNEFLRPEERVWESLIPLFIGSFLARWAGSYYPASIGNESGPVISIVFTIIGVVFFSSSIMT